MTVRGQNSQREEEPVKIKKVCVLIKVKSVWEVGRKEVEGKKN